MEGRTAFSLQRGLRGIAVLTDGVADDFSPKTDAWSSCSTAAHLPDLPVRRGRAGPRFVPRSDRRPARRPGSSRMAAVWLPRLVDGRTLVLLYRRQGRTVSSLTRDTERWPYGRLPPRRHRRGRHENRRLTADRQSVVCFFKDQGLRFRSEPRPAQGHPRQVQPDDRPRHRRYFQSLFCWPTRYRQCPQFGVLALALRGQLFFAGGPWREEGRPVVLQPQAAACCRRPSAAPGPATCKSAC